MSRSSGFASERLPAEAADDLSARMDARNAEPMATVVRFTKLLPGWLRRCGVRRSDLDDAVQEASLEVLEKLGSTAESERLSEAQARHELMRIVSNVALRVRRRLQREGDRYSSVEPTETLNSRDEEAWVEARALVLTAIENLDEQTRALIFAHEVEGRTNVEIAARLKLKEDAVEYRVHVAKQRLRTEVEHLEYGRLRVRGGASVAGCFGLVWQNLDPTDRALIGAVHDALRELLLFSGRVPNSPSTPGRPGRPSRLSQPGRPSMPTTALMGALVFAPMVPTNPHSSTVPEVKRISSVEWLQVPSVAQEQSNSVDTPNAVVEVQPAVLPARNTQEIDRPLESKVKVARESVKAKKQTSVRVPNSFVVSSVPESRD